MDHFSKEADFEHALIEALQRYGWEYTGQDRQIHSDQTILSHPTEQDLIDNWAKIIYENNNSIDRLNDCPLTKEEMDRDRRFASDGAFSERKGSPGTRFMIKKVSVAAIKSVTTAVASRFNRYLPIQTSLRLLLYLRNNAPR